MNRQNNLIPIMARRYRIERGTTEPVEQWQMRVIYSVLGQMADASLWDKTEDDQPISFQISHEGSSGKLLWNIQRS